MLKYSKHDIYLHRYYILVLYNFDRELESKLHIIQEENQQQKQTLEELKTNHLKEKESSREILKNMESKLSFQNQSLSSLVKKMSNEVSDSDVKNMNSLEVCFKCFCKINVTN